MKKHFILLSTFAALTLSATMLTGCGEDVQELVDNDNNGETVTETTVGENCTLFSTGDDGTRTALGYDRKFYWSEGDQIYVNTDGANYKKTSSSMLSSDKRTADFVLEGVTLTAEKCSVVYIGNGTTAATATKNDLKVKIEATQTQAAWGDTAHIGRAGDCGVAEAEKVGGKYTFNLRHKASYLVFQPYRPAGTENPDWKLTKIEIIANGTNLAGTYDFGTGELVGAGSSNTIEFNCGTNGFDLNHTAPATAKSCFAVIQPGQHELTIRYTVKIPGKENVMLFTSNGGYMQGTMSFEKKIATRAYNANIVTTIRHELAFPLLSIDYYQWGASDTYMNTVQTGNYDKTTKAPTQLTMTSPVNWAGLPNANELYWYAFAGDPRWDGTTQWSIDGGWTVCTGGVWLKKKQYIAGFSSTVGKDGVDMRSGAKTYNNNSTTYQTAGKPANSVIGQYFFLPALGYYDYTLLRFFGSHGYYWSRSPFIGALRDVYGIDFSSEKVLITYTNFRESGFVVAPRWFQ